MFPISSKQLPNFFEDFQIFFQFFSKCYPSFYNFHFCKILPSFLKTVAKFFIFQNFTRNFGIPTSVVQCFYSFFKISSQLIIRSYTTSLRNPFKKTGSFPEISLKFFNNLANWFQNVSTVRTVTLRGVSKELFARERMLHGHWRCQLKILGIYKLFSVFLLFAPLGTLPLSVHGVNLGGSIFTSFELTKKIDQFFRFLFHHLEKFVNEETKIFTKFKKKSSFLYLTINFYFSYCASQMLIFLQPQFSKECKFLAITQNQYSFFNIKFWELKRVRIEIPSMCTARIKPY